MSPIRSPDDLLPVFEESILSTTSRERLSLKKLEELAKKAFHIPKPLVLLVADNPIVCACSRNGCPMFSQCIVADS